jgi:hypothetical protein
VPARVYAWFGTHDVRVLPDSPLIPGATYVVNVSGVEDEAGNVVVPFSAAFTAGIGVDTVGPRVVESSFAYGATDVPVNASYRVLFSEALDPGSVSTETAYIRDDITGARVAGSASLEGDRLAVFVPNAPLAAGRPYTGVFEVRDLAGNAGSTGSQFRTAPRSDTSAPQLLGLSPAQGATGLPRNTAIQAAFDEPVSPLGLPAAITLSSGAAVPVRLSLTDGGRLVSITPYEYLAPNTSFTLTVGAVTDLAGNVRQGSTTRTFSTAEFFDFSPPYLVSSFPQLYQYGVARDVVVTALFSEALEPMSVNEASVVLSRNGLVTIPAAIGLSADGRTIRITPASILDGSTSYSLYLTDSIADPSGHRFAGTYVHFTTAP